jgi:hypothetical protein
MHDAKEDLRELLRNWPFDAENNIRRVRGADGREVMQVRLPMGIEQYELEGRPDGQRPHGLESLLEYHVRRLFQAEAAGQREDFELTPAQCAEMFDEGTLYYFRYLHLFQSRDWNLVVRDTRRNIELFDFVQRHARRDEDRQHLEKWRPYILRIHAVACAMIELERGRTLSSREMVAAAIQKIETLPELDNETFRFERERSLEALRELCAEIDKHRALSPLEKLEKQLEQAVAEQQFERAAQLRDLIRSLRDRPQGGGN